jgi:hypothetical protein
MPFQQVPGHDVKYALINFDDGGRERTDDPEGGVFSRAIQQQVQQKQPSHIFLFSHGWKGDVPSAIDQYNRWIGAMWKLDADRAAMGPAFRPFFIGLHWPSLPWGEETLPPSVSFGVGPGGDIQPILDAAVAHFGGGDAVRRPLDVIFRAFQQDPAARVLPADVVDAYMDLGRAIGFSADDRTGEAAPDAEGAPLDPQAAVRAERVASAGEAFGIGGGLRNGILAGLRQASFWLMKHRARTVGEGGMHAFVSELQRTSNANVHLIGHSFGCIVVSSILGGTGGTGRLTRPANSAALVQGALSHWSYADTIPYGNTPGYFRNVIANGAVSGALITTQSANDKAVGIAYPAAVGLVNEFAFDTTLPKFGAIGTWGIQGAAGTETLDIADERGTYHFKARGVYNVNCSKYVPDHSGIDGPQVAHLLWQAARAGERP